MVIRRLLTGLATLFLASQASATLMFTGNFQTGTGQIQITSDIHFAVNTTSSALGLAFDEAVTSDGGADNGGVPLTPDTVFSINGGADSSVASLFVDNNAASVGDLTANDGYLLFQFVQAVSVGDTFILRAGTYDAPVLGGSFNSQWNDYGVFSGQLFLFDSGGSRVSEFASAPAPAVFSLLGIGTLGLLLTPAGRRRLARA